MPRGKPKAGPSDEGLIFLPMTPEETEEVEEELRLGEMWEAWFDDHIDDALRDKVGDVLMGLRRSMLGRIAKLDDRLADAKHDVEVTEGSVRGMSAEDLVHNVFVDVLSRTFRQPAPHDGRLRAQDVYELTSDDLDAAEVAWDIFNGTWREPLRLKAGEPAWPTAVEHMAAQAPEDEEGGEKPEREISAPPDVNHELTAALQKALAILTPRHRGIVLRVAEGEEISNAEWSAFNKARTRLQAWLLAQGFVPPRPGAPVRKLRGEESRLAWADPNLDPWDPKRKPTSTRRIADFTARELEVFKATRKRLSTKGLDLQPTPAMASLHHFAALIPDDVHLRPTDQEGKERETVERWHRVAKVPVKDTPGNPEVGGSWSERWPDVRGNTLKWGRDGWGLIYYSEGVKTSRFSS